MQSTSATSSAHVILQPHLFLLLANTQPLLSLCLGVFVRIQLRPHLVDMRPLLLSRLAILPCLLQSQTAQTHVDFVLGVGAVAGYFPEEATGVAFVERCDDFGAAWGVLVAEVRR